jgi:hypothetical protein
MSLTAAIDVLFSVNCAVVFDFMYFGFRHSKAISIGDVLMNRQNAANYLLRHFNRSLDHYFEFFVGHSLLLKRSQGLSAVFVHFLLLACCINKKNLKI